MFCSEFFEFVIVFLISNGQICSAGNCDYLFHVECIYHHLGLGCLLSWISSASNCDFLFPHFTHCFIDIFWKRAIIFWNNIWWYCSRGHFTILYEGHMICHCLHCIWYMSNQALLTANEDTFAENQRKYPRATKKPTTLPMAHWLVGGGRDKSLWKQA